jgi:hypothetical protein
MSGRSASLPIFLVEDLHVRITPREAVAAQMPNQELGHGLWCPNPSLRTRGYRLYNDSKAVARV